MLLASCFRVKETGACPNHIQTSFHYCRYHSPMSSDLPRSATEGYLCCFCVTNKRDKKLTFYHLVQGMEPRFSSRPDSLKPKFSIYSCVCFGGVAAGIFLFGLYLFETELHIV